MWRRGGVHRSPLCDEWLTVTVRKPEVSLCLARGERSAAAEPGLRPGQGAQLIVVLQAALEGGRDVSASLARWIPLLEALASVSRSVSGPAWVWCVLRRTSHPGRSSEASKPGIPPRSFAAPRTWQPSYRLPCRRRPGHRPGRRGAVPSLCPRAWTVTATGTSGYPPRYPSPSPAPAWRL